MDEFGADIFFLKSRAHSFAKQKNASTLKNQKIGKKSMFFRWRSTIPDNNCSTPYYNRDQNLLHQTSETFQDKKKIEGNPFTERGE